MIDFYQAQPQPQLQLSWAEIALVSAKLSITHPPNQPEIKKFKKFNSKCISRTGIGQTKTCPPYTSFGITYTKNGGAPIPKLV